MSSESSWWTAMTEPDAEAKARHAVDGFHYRHRADASDVVDIARAFHAQRYFLEMLTAEDRRHDLQRMRLIYTYNSYLRADRHLVVVELPGDIPGAEAPSIAHVIPGANWFEREVYDMYGVRFVGHPKLERILLPEDANFHALLKDFGRIEDAKEGGE